MNQPPPRPDTLRDWGQADQVVAPAEALQFAAGSLELAADPDENGRVPIEMVARSGKPIDHWWWGRVVHDLAGMHLHKPTLPIDYAHYDGEILGYLDEFDASSGDLVVKGQLVPFTDGDRAREVIHKARAGVPYESSIFFGGPGIKIEDVDADSSAEVNGQTFDGPITIIRSWPLRGVAVCPYGADPNTPVKLHQPETVPITRLSRGSTMTKKPKADAAALAATDAPADQTPPADAEALEKATDPSPAPAAPSQASDPPPAGDQATDTAAPGRRFLDAFGPQGGVWFAEGRSFEEAQALHTKSLREEVAELRERLAAVDRGLAQPADFTPADDQPADRQRKELTPALGDNLATVAAGLNFRRN